jgi:long-chain acyl-CoA synthetase
MIVLGGGKKVFPEEVEEIIGKSPYIKEICVLARTAQRGVRKGHEEVYAIIAPELEILGQDNITTKEEISSKISREISRLSKNLSAHKRIMNFDLYYDELPKTATKKIRRDAVARIADSLITHTATPGKSYI